MSQEPVPPPRSESAGAAGTCSDISPPTPAQTPLRELLDSSLVSAEDWEGLPAPVRDELGHCLDPQALLPLLVRHGLLTEYQAARVLAGTTAGLILGHYRVLDRLGGGAVATVFRAEHCRLRHPVAVKVIPSPPGQGPLPVRRFDAEIRAVAHLHHPNVVRALDAGEVAGPEPGLSVLHYYVMEYIEGQDLEALVQRRGPLPVAQACALACQVAGALAEAHAHGLVHRDVKPSNVMVTSEGRAKLLDFGLVHHLRSRLTRPDTFLGTLEYVAPEQTRDAGAVDVRADVYGLGGTLFWSLTGQTPFTLNGGFTESVHQRRTLSVPSARTYRPEVPAELDAVVSRMMALDPEERYPTPQAVTAALRGFLQLPGPERELPALAWKAAPTRNPARRSHILVVEDNHESAESLRLLLELFGYEVTVTHSGPAGVEAARHVHPDAVVCDIGLPGLDGYGVAGALRGDPGTAGARLIAVTGYGRDEDRRRALAAGFDRHLVKPVEPERLLEELGPAGLN